MPLADEAAALLHKFNEWGLVVWYDQVLLRDIVVLNPGWLIDVASTIIRDPALHKLDLGRKTTKKMDTELKALYESAVLVGSLLPHLFPDDDDRFTEAVRGQLMALLESFSLVAPLELGRSETSGDQEKRWLVPALLHGDGTGAELPKLSQAPRHVCLLAWW